MIKPIKELNDLEKSKVKDLMTKIIATEDLQTKNTLREEVLEIMEPYLDFELEKEFQEKFKFLM